MNTLAEPDLKQLGAFRFYLCSLIVGVIGALGAVVFRGLIAFFHNLLFLGQWSVFYDTNAHTPASPWGAWIILVPVLGAAGVAFLVGNFAPEAKGHGVPEVMDAIYYKNGKVRLIVAVIKSLASSLSIGSGGSIGREGPIIQIGASFGSSIGGWLRVPTWQRITLIAAGGGAGIAATFNTPVGGVLFAVEILMHEISARTLVPVAIATMTSSYIGRLILGNHPSFDIPKLSGWYFQVTNPYGMIFYLGLGVITGLVSVVYIRSIYAFEDFFEGRVPGGYYVRHMLGMLGVGIIMYVLLATRGHYYVEGVGYATVQDVLSGELSWFLLVLFVLKLLTTSLTLGSGASGGVFSPSLFMGATLGGVYGMAARLVFPGLPIAPEAFAVAGMAGVVAGATGAAMAAIVMIFEMTLDYTVIIPLTITVALSHGIRTLLQRESIYTMKPFRRGHAIPVALRADLHYLRQAKDMMDSQFATVPAAGSLEDWAEIAAQRPGVSYFLVHDGDTVFGFLMRDFFPPKNPPVALRDLADARFVTVGENMQLFEVMNRMRLARASVALVTDGTVEPVVSHIRGLVARQQIAETIIGGTSLF